MSEFINNLVLPYYAHCQAWICPPIPSIAWNKVASASYLDVLLSIREKTIRSSYHRKLSAFYDLYEKEVKSRPLLGELDTLSRNFTHLDLANPQAVSAFASRWSLVVNELETFCFERISQQKIGERENLLESLQSMIFTLSQEETLPGWNDLLAQQQDEVIQLFQLNNYPKSALAKFNLSHQYWAVFHTEKQPVAELLGNDPELKELLRNWGKTFLTLINTLNNKLPAPSRNLRVNPAHQDLSEPQDYRLTVTFTYNGKDRSELETNFFSALRNLIK